MAKTVLISIFKFCTAYSAICFDPLAFIDSGFWLFGNSVVFPDQSTHIFQINTHYLAGFSVHVLIWFHVFRTNPHGYYPNFCSLSNFKSILLLLFNMLNLRMFDIKNSYTNLKNGSLLIIFRFASY